jgi:hypothetical protein
MISREKFVKICTDAIIKTTKVIKAENQKSGYLTYHNEVKRYKYIDKVFRKNIDENKSFQHLTLSEFLSVKHKAIEMAGIGRCSEFAVYLFVELIKTFRDSSIDANVSRVSAEEKDHSYLRIEISLENEHISTWEIDAWNPRIIDASRRNDGSIKNAKKLYYGTDPLVEYTLSSKNFREPDWEKIELNFRLPKKDGPERFFSRSKTPEADLFKKHEYLYSDYSIDDAYKNRDLPKKRLRYPQRASPWQKIESQEDSFKSTKRAKLR